MKSFVPGALAPIDWNLIIRRVIILAVAIIAYSALLYVLEFNTASIGTGIVSFLLTLAIGTIVALMTVSQQRTLDGGFISFRRALLVGGITASAGIFISSLWGYFLVNFIDEDYPTRLKEQFVEKWGEAIPPDKMEEALSGFDKMGDLGGALQQGLFAGLFMGLVCGLIAAAIGQKKPPQQTAS